jgi:hypothetical protein
MSGKNTINKTKYERNNLIADYMQAQLAENPNWQTTQRAVCTAFPQYSEAMVRNTIGYFVELRILNCRAQHNKNLQNIYTVAENANWLMVKATSTDPANMADARFSYEATAYAHQVLAKAFGLPHINQPHQ